MPRVINADQGWFSKERGTLYLERHNLILNMMPLLIIEGQGVGVYDNPEISAKKRGKSEIGIVAKN